MLEWSVEKFAYPFEVQKLKKGEEECCIII